MCLAFPGKIKERKGDKATIDFDGVEKEINVFYTPDVVAGDYVAVHAGFSIQKLSERDALESMKFYDEVSKSAKNS